MPEYSFWINKIEYLRFAYFLLDIIKACYYNIFICADILHGCFIESCI